MKANEAPEKLYMNWVNYPLEEMQVEYTRTDAFVEKACEFILKYAADSNPYGISNKAQDRLIKEFKKAMNL